jgi:hypothetical protein
MPDDTRPTFGQALAAADTSATDSGSTPAAPVADAQAAPAEATAGSSPATTTDPVSPATAATQPGTGDGSTPLQAEEPEPVGPVPLDRHKAVIENTRTKSHEEGRQAARTQFAQEYGFIATLPPVVAQQASSIVRQLVTDPVTFLVSALDELSAQPQYAAALRSHVARLLGSRQNGNGGNGHALAQAPAPAQDDADLDPDIAVENYRWHSAEQLAQLRQRDFNRLLSAVRSEFAPLVEDMQTRRERDAIIAATQKANEYATSTLAEMHRLPHFTEQKAEIEKVFRAMPPMPDHLVGQAIRDAYIQVLTTKVLPTLSNTAKADLLSNLNQKAAASARNPAVGSVAVASRPKSFEEALRANAR